LNELKELRTNLAVLRDRFGRGAEQHEIARLQGQMKEIKRKIQGLEE
jgi:hypothetical protein